MYILRIYHFLFNCFVYNAAYYYKATCNRLQLQYLHDYPCIIAMVYSWYVKQWILHYYQCGLLPSTIAKHFEEEGTIKTSWTVMAKFIKKFKTTGSIARTLGSFKYYQQNKDDRRRTDEGRWWNNSYPSTCFANWNGYQVSKKTILHCCTTLVWTFMGSTYCQLICEANKLKRLEWAKQYRNDTFDNVIWTDEYSVQWRPTSAFAAEINGRCPA